MKQLTFKYLIDHLDSETTVKIKLAKPTDKNKVGIHLLNPSVDEIHDAINVAERDLFPAIYVYLKS